MKPLNLSWGNPDFLSPYWDKVDLSIQPNIQSSYLFSGLDSLKKSIKELHKKEQNSNTEGKYVVIGNGATQILLALLHCLRKPVVAIPPYFMRFPILADLAKLPWKYCPNGVEIITTPNNPNGEIAIECALKTKTRIYDLSYNWKQYCSPYNYDEEIMVFSLSKATGHASTRVGWAIIKDELLANSVQKYIEQTTAGVSIEAQLKAQKIIEHQLHTKNTCFVYGRKILRDRHKIINNNNYPFIKKCERGMFLWAAIKSLETYDILEKQNIIYTPGAVFGSSSQYFRLNIGCSEENFKELIKRLT